MEWIHERADWPSFSWDSAALTTSLAAVRHRQGEVLGRMRSLGFDLRSEARLATLTTDVVTSSAIEGELLSREEVRSSIARHLGLETGGFVPPGRDVEGIVEVMLNATREYDSPLTEDRLLSWHAALFPTGRSGVRRITVGAWRTDNSGPMQVLSGPMGCEKIHFVAPAAQRLPHEMERFLEWFNTDSDVDPVLRAALAHFWFVTVHPFDDGNGRIARAIADMSLARADQSAERYYSMSSQIESERSSYYNQLERLQRGDLDITEWMRWFLACLGRSLEGAEEKLAAVLYKARFWEMIGRHSINERQRAVLHRMLGDFEGHLNTSKYAKLAKCSNDTALRDIRELLDLGIVVRNAGGGRSTSYRLVSLENGHELETST